MITVIMPLSISSQLSYRYRSARRVSELEVMVLPSELEANQVFMGAKRQRENPKTSFELLPWHVRHEDSIKRMFPQPQTQSKRQAGPCLCVSSTPTVLSLYMHRKRKTCLPERNPKRPTFFNNDLRRREQSSADNSFLCSSKRRAFATTSSEHFPSSDNTDFSKISKSLTVYVLSQSSNPFAHSTPTLSSSQPESILPTTPLRLALRSG